MLAPTPRSPLQLILTGLLLVLMLVGSGGLVGCATVMSDGGGDRPLHLTSQPSGAAVYVKRGMQEWQRQPGETPTTIYLDPAAGNGDYQLKLELEGYEPVLGYISSDIDPWVAGSAALIFVFVVPGLIATGVDVATGAWKKLDQEQMHFEFPQQPGVANAGE